MSMPGAEPTTLVRTMLRPRWIVALFVALGVAAGFAALGQWQLGRALASGHVVVQPTETVRPLARVATPGAFLKEKVIGQMVSAHGRYVPADAVVVADRADRGRAGYWVVGRLQVGEQGADGRERALAVARGWTPSLETARSVRDRLRRAAPEEVDLVGRLVPSQAPQVPRDRAAHPQRLTTLSVAHLVNVWHDADDLDVYTGYVVDRRAPAGLAPIFSPAPSQEAEINWLNVFYAAEWAIFAGFAVYFWFRLAKDAWERERDEWYEERGREAPSEKVEY